MTRRESAIAVGALLLGLALAFPLGLMLGGDEHGAAPARSEATGMGRQMFSPRVLSDPDFLEQQEANVVALERACREHGQMCAEAEGAREWLERRRGG